METDHTNNIADHTHVFVYGTLKQGFANNHLLAGCVLLGPAATAMHYELHDFGAYPGLLDAGATSVQGEVWLVPPQELPKLDRFEGVHVQLFIRKEVQLLPPFAAAQAYFINPKVPGGIPLPSGMYNFRGKIVFAD